MINNPNENYWWLKKCLVCSEYHESGNLPCTNYKWDKAAPDYTQVDWGLTGVFAGVPKEHRLAVLMELRKQKIAACFGVPKELLGIEEEK